MQISIQNLLQQNNSVNHFNPLLFLISIQNLLQQNRYKRYRADKKQRISIQNLLQQNVKYTCSGEFFPIFQYKICYSKILWLWHFNKFIYNFNTKFVIAKYFAHYIFFRKERFQYKICYSKIEALKEAQKEKIEFQYKICYSKMLILIVFILQSTLISIQNLLQQNSFLALLRSFSVFHFNTKFVIAKSHCVLCVRFAH